MKPHVLHDPSRNGDTVADARGRHHRLPGAWPPPPVRRRRDWPRRRRRTDLTTGSGRPYAAWDLGAVLTQSNPALTPDEIAYRLTVGVRLAVVKRPPPARLTSLDRRRHASRQPTRACCGGHAPTTWPCSSTRRHEGGPT
jgi:hypothetical protein